MKSVPKSLWTLACFAACVGGDGALVRVTYVPGMSVVVSANDIGWSGTAEQWQKALREACGDPAMRLSGHAKIGPCELAATVLYAPLTDGTVATLSTDPIERGHVRQEIYDDWYTNGGRIEVGIWRERERAEWSAKKLAGLPCSDEPPAGFTVDGITVD